MKLKVKKINYETGNKKNIIINVKDAQVLGQKAGDRLIVKNIGSKSLEERYWIGILQIDYSNSIVSPGEIGISLDILKEKREIKDNMVLSIKPAELPDSFRFIQKKIKGNKLNSEELNKIISDAATGLLSRIDLAAFITSVNILGMDNEEMTALTLAEARSGETFDFGPDVFDKHSTKNHNS